MTRTNLRLTVQFCLSPFGRTGGWKVNKLMGAWNGDKREDSVLVRVYGLGTEKIIYRRVEVENMVMGSKLFATFTNGICYQFLHGDDRSTE